MTVTTQFHEAIASDELLDGLARFAAVEAFTEGEAQRLGAAEGELLEADRGSPAQRDLAAGRLAGVRLLAARNGPARLDAQALIAVRRATADALRYTSDRAEFEPLADPRDRPRRLHPADRATLEGQARLRHALASLRRMVDTWHHEPGKFDHAAVVAMLERASAACHEADAFRATLLPPAPAPAPVPVSKQRHRK
jgi:hypothetical protein